MEKECLDSDKVHTNLVCDRRFTRRMLQDSVSSQAVMNQAISWNVPNQFKNSNRFGRRSKKNSDPLESSLSEDAITRKCSSQCQLSDSIIESTEAFVETKAINVGNNTLDGRITEECSLNVLDSNLNKNKECQDNNENNGELVSTKKSTLYGAVSRAPVLDEEKVSQKIKSNITTYLSTDIRYRKKDTERNTSKDQCFNSNLFDQEHIERLFHKESLNLNMPCKKESPIQKKKKKKYKKNKHVTQDETTKALQQSTFNYSKVQSHSISRGEVKNTSLPIKNITRFESSKTSKPQERSNSKSRLLDLRSNFCKDNYSNICKDGNSNKIREELMEVLEKQETILQIEIDGRRKAATSLETAVQKQMENANIVKELFLKDVLGKLNLIQQKDRAQQMPFHLNLSELLSLEFTSELLGHSILRCVGEFLRYSPGNVKVDESSKGVILFKFKTRRCLEELMMKQCRGKSKKLENICKLDERLSLRPDPMHNDWVVCVMTQHHSIQKLRCDLKGFKVKSIQARNKTHVWHVKFARLVDCFEMMLNGRFKKDVVFILSVHQQLMEHRLIELINQGRACLTEQQLLSLVWRGEYEEYSTNVSNRELYRTCLTRFLTTSQLETVEADENKELLLVYSDKETLEIDMIHHCRSDWSNLVLKKSQRVLLLWGNKLGLAFQSGKELDPTLFSDQIGPWQMEFDHFVVNKRVLVKILRDPQLKDINQNLVVSSNSFFFKDKVKNVVKKEPSSDKIVTENYSFNSFQYWQIPVSEVMLDLEKTGIFELIGATKEVGQHIPEVEQNIIEIVQSPTDDGLVQVKEENIDKYNSVLFWKTPLVEIEIPFKSENNTDNCRVKTAKSLIIDVISESEVSE